MKLHHWRSVPLAMLLLATSGLAQAEDDQTISAFVASCFQYVDKPEELTAKLDNVAQRLDGKSAQNFLTGRTGKAWLMTHEDKVYGFALLDQGICTMTAISGDPKAIVSDFVLFGKTAEDSYKVEWEPVTTEDGWDEHAYTLFDPDNPTDIYMRMALNKAAGAHVRAIVSVGRIPDDEP
jgi:hypothetical protein